MDIIENDKNEKYNINLPIFSGPLDLLLFLIKSQEINIYDIPISKITEQFVNYLQYLNKLNIEISSEFILMLSELIYIKTKSLLPVREDSQDDQFLENLEDPRKELVEKLLEYKKYSQALEIVDQKSNEIPIFYGNKNILFDIHEEGEWKPLSVLEIVKSFSEVLIKYNKEEKTYLVKTTLFTVEDKINLIKQKLQNKNEFFLEELIESKEFDKIEFICIFLAILEMVKLGFIRLFQNNIFGEIKIVKLKFEL
ncbi:MAG: segregation/condensation protein A [Spirochaetes bacterium]|nr:segregation/condensation protein A [Spirochaetota bacterium]